MLEKKLVFLAGATAMYGSVEQSVATVKIQLNLISSLWRGFYEFSKILRFIFFKYGFLWRIFGKMDFALPLAKKKHIVFVTAKNTRKTRDIKICLSFLAGALKNATKICRNFLWNSNFFAYYCSNETLNVSEKRFILINCCFKEICFE